MKQQLLPRQWTMQDLGTGQTVPAEIPGSVYSAMLAAGTMEDPFWRDNEMEALALMDRDYRFSCRFAPEAPMLQCGRVLLRCEGLDTIADIELNGQAVGHAENMHRTWEFDVKALLREGENELSVTFRSPTKWIAEHYARVKTDGSTDAMRGFSQLRKAHCMFGWDWGPRLPDAGIFRDIMLLGIESGRIDSVYITQKHEGGAVRLYPAVEIDGAGCTWEMEVTAPCGKTYSFDRSAGCVEIADPALWWPHGYGGQPLYTVTVRLLDGTGGEADRWERRIGLRTMRIKREKDQWGESFELEVNGVSVFSMGADYIPEDNILQRVTPARTRELLEQCTAVNMNSIRVWGGGYYPDDFFYDACDELGLVVWQDCMFACAMYQPSEAFTETVKQELADNIKRLRHHASLGLWCGNNEMEWQVDDGTYEQTPEQVAYYTELYESIIPAMVQKYDPNTFYWPSSPSCGGGFDNPNDPNRGDTHYWDVWHKEKPFTDYRNYFFRYASEFGFQSLPSLKTVEAFTEPEDRNMFSYIMEKHQRNASANARILAYMGQTFRYPESFADVIYVSQLLQAEAIKYGVEHWRRNRGRCMGAIYWQLNDCWPVVSWASIDYFGRWKALHYYAKRFFAPVMLSCEEEGTLTQLSNVNEQPPIRVEKSARLSVANETMHAFHGTVRYALRDASAKVIASGAEAVEVPALTSIWLPKLDEPEASLYSNYLSYSLEDEAGTVVSEGTVLFCAPKHFAFQDPKLTYTVSGDTITVRASAYARCVEIDCADTDMVLSDNYFDMNAGEKTVKVLSGRIGDIQLKSIYNIGR